MSAGSASCSTSSNHRRSSRRREQLHVACQAAAAAAEAAPAIIKVPTSIHEVDNGKILGFGADLSEDHPVRPASKPAAAAAALAGASKPAAAAAALAGAVVGSKHTSLQHQRWQRLWQQAYQLQWQRRQRRW